MHSNVLATNIMTNAAGNVFLITAPSGAGKSSLVNALLAQDPDLQLSVSCTTRAPRDGEINGRDYHFVSEAEFLAMREQSNLLEWALVHGNYYGTPREPLEKALESGQDIMLEIDWQGAAQVRQLLPAVIGIFVLPPSLDALESRLRTRAKDSDEVIASRMAAAASEIAHAHEFDYVIVNQTFDEALAQLSHIVACARLRYPRQALTHALLFNSLGLSGQ